MAKLFVAIFLGICLPNNVQNLPPQDRQEEEKLECLLMERIQVIENLHGIKFDDNWEPLVEFGYPENFTSVQKRYYGASYLPDTQSFQFSPEEKHDTVASLLDHELGHALMDQVSRRNGYGPWPNLERFDEMSENEKISIKVLSEGVGTYFEHGGKPPYRLDDESGENWLPDGPEDRAWSTRDFMYKGGRWIVAPIIKQFGERGLVYLITHPIKYRSSKLRTGAKIYREKALKELSSSETSRLNEN